jgi:hypothetical protein
MILGVVVYRVWKANHRSALRQSSIQIPVVTQVDQGSVISSPEASPTSMGLDDHSYG